VSVIDDIKNKMGNDSSGGNLDSSLDDDFGDGGLDLDSQSGSQGRNPSQPQQGQSPQRGQRNPANPQNTGRSSAQRQGSQTGNSPAKNSQNSGAPNLNNSRGNPQRRSQSPNSRNSRSPQSQSPNPQSGRPQPGNSSPQLSQNTKKEMEHAGMDPDPQSVSDQRSDMQELKAQNQQIIDLLKRINQNLQGV
jgi:hypothetical protein